MGFTTAEQLKDIKAAALKEGIDKGVYLAPQTGPSRALINNPLQLGASGLNPDRVLLREGGGLLRYYRDLIEKDQVLQAVITRRKSRVKALPRRVVPASSGPDGPTPHDEMLARFSQAWIDQIPRWRQILDDLLESDALGHAISEIIYAERMWEGRKVLVPGMIQKRDQDSFSYRLDTHELLWDPTQSFFGDSVVEVDRVYPGKHIRMSMGSTNNPWGEALARLAHSEVQPKRNLIQPELVAINRQGFGTLWGKIKRGGSPAEDNQRAQELLDSLVDVQTNNALVTANDEEIAYLESRISQGGANMFERRIARADKYIAQVGLGQTLTIGEGEHGGNRALGGVHLAGEDMLIISLAEVLDDVISDQAIKWPIMFTFGEQEKYPRYETNVDMIRTDTAELEEDEKLQNMGYKFTHGQMAKKYSKPIAPDVDPNEIMIPLDSIPTTGSSHEPENNVPGPKFAEDSPHRRRGKANLTEYLALLDRVILEGSKATGKQSRDFEEGIVGMVTSEEVSAFISGDSGRRIQETASVLADGLLALQLLGRAHIVETTERLGEDEEPAIITFAEHIRLTQKQIAETPFGDLINIFRERSAVVDTVFDTLDQEMKAQTFSFTGAQDQRAAANIQKILADTFAQGGTLDDFKAVAREAWTRSSFQLETVFKTNAQQAYTAGVDAQFDLFGIEEYPLAELVTQGDEDVRATHRVWDGFRAPPDDPIWKQMAPLNDYNCRCNKQLIHASEVAAENLNATPDTTKDALRREAPAVFI